MLAPLLFAALAVGPADADNWPRFRGPDGSATAPDAAVPLSWDGTTGDNIRWHAPLPGPGASSPVVWGDAVFVTYYTGYGTGDGFDTEPGDDDPGDLVRHLVRLDRDTGEIVWTKDMPATAEEDPYRGFISEHGYATSTPCTDGRRVYCYFGKTGAVAFDFDGNELWRRVLGTESGPRGWGSGGSPVLVSVGTDEEPRDLLIVNACEEAQALVALDPATGEEVWRAAAKSLEQSWTTPVARVSPADAAFPNRRELLFPIPDELWGLDPADGDLLWYAEVPVDGSACTSPVSDGSAAYVVGGRQGGGAAVALGTATGGNAVPESAVKWTTREGTYVPSPLLLDVNGAKRLFWVDDRGVAVSLDAATGEEVFKSRLPTDGLTAAPGDRRGRGGASLYASPVLVGAGEDARVLATTRAGDTFVIVPGDALTVDRVNKLGPEGGRCNASPAVAGDALFLRTDRGVWCVAGNR